MKEGNEWRITWCIIFLMTQNKQNMFRKKTPRHEAQCTNSYSVVFLQFFFPTLRFWFVHCTADIPVLHVHMLWHIEIKLCLMNLWIVWIVLIRLSCFYFYVSLLGSIGCCFHWFQTGYGSFLVCCMLIVILYTLCIVFLTVYILLSRHKLSYRKLTIFHFSLLSISAVSLAWKLNILNS